MNAFRIGVALSLTLPVGVFAQVPQESAEKALSAEHVNWAAEQAPATAAKGTQWEFLATAEQTGGAYALLQITAGVGAGPPLHTHVAREGFYVLDGDFELIRGTERIVVAKGAFVAIPPRVAHRWRNIGKTPGRVLCLISPGGLEGLFKELGDPVPNRALPPGAPGAKKDAPDVISKKYGVEMMDSPKAK